MEYEKIIDLIHEIESSSITDFALQKGEFRISIKKEGTKEPKAEDDRTIDIEERGNRKRETQEQDVLIEEGTMIRSPLVGVFHAAKTQDGEAQVAIGSHIDEGQILGAPVIAMILSFSNLNVGPENVISSTPSLLLFPARMLAR